MPLCAPVVPKGSGFAFPVSSVLKNDAFAASWNSAFPIRQSDRRFSPHVVPCFIPACCSLLLVTKYGQRPLAENTVGTRKTHNQCQQHREEKTDTKHLRVYVPGKLEHI